MKTTIASIALSVIAVVIAVVTLAGSFHSSGKVGAVYQPAGGTVQFTPDTYAGGLNIGGKYINWVSFVIPIGANQASWCNNTGHVVYGSGARFALASTTANGSVSAANSLVLSVGTSTKSTVTDSTALYGGLINQAFIATSSNAFDRNSQVIIGGNAGGGTISGVTASSTIAIAPAECVVAALENPYSASAGYATTSTRGYVLNGVVEYSF